MKKYFLILIAFMLTSLVSLADTVEVTDMSLMNYEHSTVSVSLNNSSAEVVAMQFNLSLPPGIEPIMKDGKVLITPTDRIGGTYVLRGSKVSDGSYLFVYVSQDRTPIAGNSGSVFSFDIKNISAADAQYSANLSKVSITNLDGSETSLNNTSFAINTKHVLADFLKVSDVELKNDETSTVSIAFNNASTDVVAMQFNLNLPAGIEPVMENGKVVFTPTNRIGESYMLRGSKVSDGSYLFVYMSQNRTPIAGDSGALFSFNIKNNSAPDAKYTASLSSARTTNLEGDETTLDDATFAIDAKHIYNLIYMVDGVVFSKSQVAYGATITPLEVPSMVGYTFSGWSEIPSTMPASDVTITGNFSVNSYTLTYMLDGQIFNTESIAYGTTLTALATPVKEGYTFSGWSEIPSTMPASDVTVTGSFSVNSYTLTYMIDGQAISTETVAYGTSLTVKTAPVKEGYTFSGWSEIPSTMPASDVTINGSFSVNSYTLTYVVDGQIISTESVAYGTSLTAKTAPVKEGYTFSGWSEIPSTMPAKDVTVTGSFSVNSYTLTYVVDGQIISTESVAYGTALTARTAPTKEGYTFSGWSEIPSTMPANDVTVTGSFSVNSYTLTYVVDGQTISTESVAYGTSLTAKTAPTKEGYTFSGWSEIPATMPAKDVTVTGSFSVNSYTLTYIVDGQTISAESVAYGTSLTAKTAPVKEGYTFSGWSEIPATMPAKDVTVTGSFSVNSYTLIYIVDGQTISTESVAYGTSLTAKTAPTKEGYTFSGWSEIPSTMPAKDVTVTGSFSINSYTLTYIVDGQAISTETVAYGTSLTAKTAPVKEGYTFSGWSEIPSNMPAKDVTVTGSFSVNSYTLTYVVDGQAISTETVAYGTSLTAKTAPTKEGYTFSGWSEIPSTMPANDVTVTGSFSVNSYTLTYVVDGELYATYEVEYGSTITLIADPVREGETFSGWKGAPETMPSRDVTISGSFGANNYTITYIVDGVTYSSEIYAYGSEVTALAAPVKEGYTFSGWSEIPATMPAKDVTVTGSFSVNSYTLTYVVDGQAISTETVAYGTSLTAKTAPTKEGYTFSGWSEIPSTMPANDVTVTGSFSVNSYTLTYVVDGELYATYEIEYGSTITLIADPVREGETFSGWKGAPETMPSRDVTISGSFGANNYTITYIVDGVTYSSEIYAYGSEVTALAAPVKEGYTFSGWSEIPSTMPAKDLVVTGSFSINSYVITYMIDDEVFKSDTIAFNDAIPEVLAPEREGYDFVEWSGLPEYMPANDLTVTAVYCKYDGIENSQYDNKYQVYDISGRFLGEMDELELGRLTPGVYIINGKKYVLR